MTDEIKIRRYSENDVAAMVAIWNEVVEDGVSYLAVCDLTTDTGA